MNMKINFLLAITLLLILQSTIAQNTNDSNVDSSYGTGIVNTHIYTIVDYHGQQIYIYKSLSNDSKNQIFYYIPIMVPQKQLNTSWIWTSGSGELRLNIMFGNDEIDDMIRQKIAKPGETDTFDVAPLIIDSFSAFIVNGNSEPLPGVQPFRRTQPNDKRMIIRFECSSELIAQKVMSGVINGDYEIQFAFFFAGFNKVSTNIVSITSDSLKSVLSKTAADGGNTNAMYIHRDQANSFVSSYLANVRKIIYKEDPNSDTSSLTSGLEEKLFSLIQKAMDSSNQEKLELNMYGQVWSPSDLNPDRLTSELNKLFTYNQAETDYRNTSDKYFDFNKEYADQLEKSTTTKGGLTIFQVSGNAEFSNSLKKAYMNKTGETTHDVISLADIKKYLDQNSIETEWNGEKIIPKSFQVYKLADISDDLQVALTATELTAQKTSNAMIRTLSTLNLPPNFDELPQTGVIQSSTGLTGEIRLYSTDSHPPFPWLFCNGTAISRIEYQRLFDAIGTKYGEGDGKLTFNLPDFRGRVPVGVDGLAIRVRDANSVGSSGGTVEHHLSIEELPPHQHDKGTIALSTDGQHSHSYSDPGHQHSITGWFVNRDDHHSYAAQDKPGYHADFNTTATNSGSIGIQIQDAGAHSHTLSGETASVGNGQTFSLMNPFLAVNYIIYSN